MGEYDAARVGAAIRRRHGAPPLDLGKLAAWAWRAAGAAARDVTTGADGLGAALWPDDLDAVLVPRAHDDVQARIAYHPAAPFAREAICRELGRALLGPGAGEAGCLDFACCLLVHPGDVAAAITTPDWPDGWVRAQRVSADLAARRLRLLGEWIDRADDGDADALLDLLGRLPLRLAAGC